MRWLRRWLYVHLFRALVAEDIAVGMLLMERRDGRESYLLYIVHLAGRSAADTMTREAARPVAKPN